MKIVAPSSLPATMAADASALYARNLLNFVNLLVDAKTGELKIDRSDEIIAAHARLHRRRGHGEELTCTEPRSIRSSPT